MIVYNENWVSLEAHIPIPYPWRNNPLQLPMYSCWNNSFTHTFLILLVAHTDFH